MTNYYVVYKGKKTGIFYTWDECKENVLGFKGAIYKKFTNKDEAESFLKFGKIDNTKQENEKEKSDNISRCFAYVDGSYNKERDICGSGGVIINNDKKFFFKTATDNKKITIFNNVGGEIEAVKYVMNFAVSNNIKSIDIYYDYQGIQSWAEGSWKANNDYTKDYAMFSRKIFKKININFIKVKAHTGVFFNEQADRLAKEAIEDFIK